MTAPDRSCERYRVRVRSHLDPSLSEWFDGLAMSQHADGTTTLTGSMVDQAALYGLLARLRDLGATLLTVERVTPAEDLTEEDTPPPGV